MKFTENDYSKFKSKYKLFLDLDGVLADFGSGVFSIFKKYPADLHMSLVWSRLVREKGFFTHLPWMFDGLDLWNTLKIFQPVILTGIPFGKWAPPQKHEWCRRELGHEVEVVTCYTKHKPEKAKKICPHGIIPVLIDDRDKVIKSWNRMGGVYIQHFSTKESLFEFNQLI